MSGKRSGRTPELDHALVVGREFPAKPGLGVDPIPLDGARGDPLGGGDLLDRHSAEHAHRDQVGGRRIGRPKLHEGIVQVQQLVGQRERDQVLLGQPAAGTGPAPSQTALLRTWSTSSRRMASAAAAKK